MTPRVLVVADVPQWAWGRKAAAYARHLAGRFDVTVAFQASREGVPPFDGFDLVHLFEVSQLRVFSERLAGRRLGEAPRVVAGLTAHVWQTWGAEQMGAWASLVDALHGNSRLLEAELRRFHPRVYYTPNGVDAEFFRPEPERAEPEGAPVVFGHVGKTNLRKGAFVIIEAARRAGEAPLRVVQRVSKLALTAEQMRDWYQGVDVMVCASNMDGTPNPMLEGAACGTALLSTPIGNMPEFIAPAPPVPGKLFDPAAVGVLTGERLPEAADPEARRRGELPAGAAEALTAELAEWMRWFSKYPETTRQMGRNARARVLESWTWERQVGHVGRMWDEVLG